jgi:hypothetical protein
MIDFAESLNFPREMLFPVVAATASWPHSNACLAAATPNDLMVDN